MTYREIVEKIISLEIQGAEKIAIAAVEAFALKMQETNDENELKVAAAELTSTRPTEPALRNALKYCMQNYKENPEVTKHVIAHFSESKEKIADYGAKKIEDGMIVFTHCHSSTVEAICIKAKQQGKNITVYNTETRPKFQGRITAENLTKAGIPVVHFVDSAGRTFMKRADIFLFGCDALSSDGKIYNKVGTDYLASCAWDNKIPSYSCTNSWKFDPQTIQGFEEEIEERAAKEVWENPPPGVTIRNPAFDMIRPDTVTGTITELGIYKPETIVLEMQKTYPWMFI